MSSYSVSGTRIARPAAWWGMVILIASESTLFGCFIGTYYYLRFRSVEWPPGGIPEPKLVVPLILLAVLVSTTIPMRLAANAALASRLAATRIFVALALVVQSGYFAYEVHDFADQLGSFDVTRNAYSSIYYTLLGADHAHVAVGLLLDLWLLAKLADRRSAVVPIAWYWHFVNVLTVVVIGTLTSVNVV
jgi:cytochrome c oxidase subunit III